MGINIKLDLSFWSLFILTCFVLFVCIDNTSSYEYFETYQNYRLQKIGNRKYRKQKIGFILYARKICIAKITKNTLPTLC